MIYYQIKSQPKKLYVELIDAQTDSIAYDDVIQIPLELDEAIEFIKGIRDQELNDTDWIIPITDHGLHASYVAYRAALRAFPESESFPLNFPVI